MKISPNLMDLEQDSPCFIFLKNKHGDHSSNARPYLKFSCNLPRLEFVKYRMDEEKPELALKLCSPLIQAFDHSEIPVQGDILYALEKQGTLKQRGGWKSASKT